MKGILGKKIGMTRVFTEDNEFIPVTLIEAGPCVVTQVRTEEKEGYSAIQIGYGEIKEKHLTKPLKGHFEKAGVKPCRYLTEVRLEKDERKYNVGDVITVEEFSVGEFADVVGISKGKGFAGVMKRWGFSGGPASHGSRFQRAPGSIGQAATPSRVFKGKKLPGRMGGERVTIRNLEIVGIDTEKNLLLLKGCVPGTRGSLVFIREAIKPPKKKEKKGKVNLLEAKKVKEELAKEEEKARAEEAKEAVRVEKVEKEETQVEEKTAEVKPKEEKEEKEKTKAHEKKSDEASSKDLGKSEGPSEKDKREEQAQKTTEKEKEESAQAEDDNREKEDEEKS